MRFLFFCFFSSFKNIRISYRGGHKVTPPKCHMVRLSSAAAADDDDNDDDDDDDDHHYYCIITTVSFFLESLLYVFISNDYIRLYSDGWEPPAVAIDASFFS